MRFLTKPKLRQILNTGIIYEILSKNCMRFIWSKTNGFGIGVGNKICSIQGMGTR